jgi:hypothetical protein
VVDWDGEVLLGFDVIDNWNNELEKVNNGKEGASYMSSHILSFNY